MSGSSSTTRIVSGTSAALRGRGSRCDRREGPRRRRRIGLSEHARGRDEDARTGLDGACRVLHLDATVDLELDGWVAAVDLRARFPESGVDIGIERLEG